MTREIAGGRQALKEVQDYPADFDGVLGGDAAINWTRFITSEMYPQIVMQRDLDGKLLSAAQLNSVSAAAVSVCDRDLNGEHSGYITDPAVCRYDPTRDPKVLCKTDGGENETPACVSRKQARAIDKMWFGQTVKAEVPDPAVANESVVVWSYARHATGRRILPGGIQGWRAAPICSRSPSAGHTVAQRRYRNAIIPERHRKRPLRVDGALICGPGSRPEDGNSPTKGICRNQYG